LTDVSGKCVPFECVNGGTSERECTNVKEGLSLEREIVRYPNVNLSFTLSKSEKIE